MWGSLLIMCSGFYDNDTQEFCLEKKNRTQCYDFDTRILTLTIPNCIGVEEEECAVNGHFWYNIYMS